MLEFIIQEAVNDDKDMVCDNKKEEDVIDEESNMFIDDETEFSD